MIASKSRSQAHFLDLLFKWTSLLNLKQRDVIKSVEISGHFMRDSLAEGASEAYKPSQTSMEISVPKVLFGFVIVFW